MDKTLNEIYSAEKKAEEIKQKAQKEAELILAEARNNVLKQITEKKEAIEKEREGIISEHQKKLKNSRERILDDGREKVERIKTKAEKKIGEAAAHITEEFRKYIK